MLSSYEVDLPERADVEIESGLGGVCDKLRCAASEGRQCCETCEEEESQPRQRNNVFKYVSF